MMIIIAVFCLIKTLQAQDTLDNYLWLEEVEGEDALKWVETQNKITEEALTGFPGFDDIYERTLNILNSKDRLADPVIRGDYLYNFWQDENNERGVWRRTTLAEYRKDDTKWETVLDVDELCRNENEKWVFKGVSWLYPDYNKCMVNLSRGGGDAVVIREFDLVSKTFVQGGFELKESKGMVSWIDDNTLIVSTDFGEGSLTTSGYPRVVKLWKRNQPLSEAKTIFEGAENDVSVWGYVINTPERNYVLISRGITFYTSYNYILEDNQLIKIEIPDDAEFNGFFKNQMLIQLKTDWNIAKKTYKQGALITIDYQKFLSGDRNFTIIAEPEEKSSIHSLASTKNLLLVNMLDNVQSELFSYYFENERWKKSKVETEEFGSIIIGSTDENSDLYFFYYESFISPSALYYVSENKEPEQIKSLPDFFDSKNLIVEQFFTKSSDDTEIPYFLVRACDMEYNGQNPTLLYGYGGFEISMRPSYSAVLGSAWLEKGGVYAIANIRGGGEFGPQWHQSALKENRQKAFDDFIAVAEDLIQRKITNPAHLGIMGGSNGGLLMGVMFTQKPELFNAVVCNVPLLDMKRYNRLLAGASWMAEYGNPDLPEEWAYIARYSPYHNVYAEKKYPKVFFYTSTKDDRVHPGHARKMAAKMIDQKHEIFYFENMEGGHAAATTNKQKAYSNALIYSYLWSMLKEIE
ncbi:MAG: S9 family peptidase [Calditrichaeota bacterium]|nr:MAG: S9 family peptidase [Calditrichota bacterium]